MDIDPRNKKMVDALYEVTARSQERRATVIWSCVAAASVVAMLMVYVEWLPGWLRMTLLVGGGIAFFVYLAWLSTTDFGKMLADFLRP